MPSICAIIPCYNPGIELINCLISLTVQRTQVEQVLLIDSSPTSNLQSFLNALSINMPRIVVKSIEPIEFDHGGTRTLGLHIIESSFSHCLLLTQDVILDEECARSLLVYMDANNLSAVHARQLPRKNASFIERAEREFNYPSASYTQRGDPRNMGYIPFSNACALYKTEDLIKVGGFVSNTPTAEDALTAYKLLESGYGVGYCSDALVFHSHNYNLRQIFNRYFDTGACHEMFPTMIRSSNLQSKGMDLVSYMLTKSHGVRETLAIVTTSTSKFLGYHTGKHHARLPGFIKQRISSNKSFWLRKH